ncbi:MAG: IS200/IS605 family transposase [Saprospiraceae bacterium]|nr:IS200/IS605 family transposase [Saprospiraceae bacterium]
MANTYTQLYIHIVFAVKGRANVIKEDWQKDLYRYIIGIVDGKKQKVYSINGMPDHLHILVSIKPDKSISDLVRDIKSNSSKWINEKGFVPGRFEWQSGFGAFSVSQGALENVVAYIKNQKEHHQKFNFREEYIRFLEEYAVDFNGNFLFEEI